MKAKELIELLEKDPELEVTISIDISTSEKDIGKRAFSTDIIEVMKSGNELVLLSEGYVN
jgi:hypothetical protein